MNTISPTVSGNSCNLSRKRPAESKLIQKTKGSTDGIRGKERKYGKKERKGAAGNPKHYGRIRKNLLKEKAFGFRKEKRKK